MARPTIEQIRSVGDFTQVFRWNLDIVKFPSGVTFNGAVDSAGLNLRCESAELPKKTNTPTEINIRGHKIMDPGISNYTNEIPLTFIETTDNIIHHFLNDWDDACWSLREGLQVSKSELEAIISIQRLDRNDTPIWEYKLFGAWLKDIEWGGTLDGATSEALKPVSTISYDYYEAKAL